MKNITCLDWHRKEKTIYNLFIHVTRSWHTLTRLEYPTLQYQGNVKLLKLHNFGRTVTKKDINWGKRFILCWYSMLNKYYESEPDKCEKILWVYNVETLFGVIFHPGVTFVWPVHVNLLTTSWSHKCQSCHCMLCLIFVKTSRESSQQYGCWRHLIES